MQDSEVNQLIDSAERVLVRLPVARSAIKPMVDTSGRITYDPADAVRLKQINQSIHTLTQALTKVFEAEHPNSADVLDLKREIESALEVILYGHRVTSATT